MPKVPLVALVHLIHQEPDESDTPGRAYLRTQRAEQLGVTARDFEQEALFNIAQRPYSLESLGPAAGVKFAIIEGDYLAAEHIIDSAALKRIHALLGESPIVVRVPARGQLYAAPLSYANKRPDDFVLFKRPVELTRGHVHDFGKAHSTDSLVATSLTAAILTDPMIDGGTNPLGLPRRVLSMVQPHQLTRLSRELRT